MSELNEKIEGYKSLLSHISIAQKTQFHKDVTDQAYPVVPVVTELAPSYTKYKADADALDAAFDQTNKSIETEPIAVADRKRDHTTGQLISRIEYVFKFPQNDTEAEKSRILKFAADSYKNAPYRDYAAETSSLRAMIAELRMEEEALSLFELTTLVNRLEFENNDFEALYNLRTDEAEAKRLRGTLKDLSVKANTSFDIFCQTVNGMMLLPQSIDKTNALKQIIHIVNARIHQYTVTYHHHLGNLAAKKKEDHTEDSDESEQ
ncbi:MAG: DUF6261 family protein [Bacteroidales bacterium]|jgi:hypothetical protein|nr:DUF6261 family protein [Bacteroidales bacterium]